MEFFDSQTISNITMLQDDIVKTGADVKLVERENIHFTLKFLGEIGEKVLDEVKKRLEGVRQKSFSVTLQGVGAFPDINYPRVVWVGVSENDMKTIEERASSFIMALSGIGEKDEKFFPHVTVARVRSGRNKQFLIDLIKENSKTVFGAATIKEVKLKSSTLTQRGPIYTDIGVYKLE